MCPRRGVTPPGGRGATAWIGGAHAAPYWGAVTTTQVRGARRVAFTGLLVAAMAASTFAAPALGILAGFIIDDLGISRAALGGIIAVLTVVAALISPAAGRITDRVGGKASLVALFAISAATFLVFGVAPGYLVLLVGAALGAGTEALTNPATNKLIAEDLPPGERGVVTGLKQSGVQVGIFVGGLTVPSLAVALGWRGAFLVVAVLPALLALAAAWVVPPAAPEHREARRDPAGPIPAAIWWMAGYGALLGFSGAVTFFIPLYAEETLGFDPRLAGAVAAAVGVVGIAGRISWSRHAERTGAYVADLGVMAVLSVLASGAFLLASGTASAFVWLAAVLVALGSTSWNSVGMLAVMHEAGTADTGRASGLVLFGFLAGLGVGPPLFGAIVDRTGSYTFMWLLSALTAFAAALLVVGWRRRHPPRSDGRSGTDRLEAPRRP